ncbi:glycosyltransferase involved in cell wall biosynthesis [Mycobacterium sp. BK558]|nr:glycosyltransferase involved in cell wall biosynthesis [Mycobacterium sp. BK558]
MTSSALRIGLVVPRFAPFRGGIETYTTRAAAALAAKGTEVTVITQAPRGAGLPRSESREGYTIERHALPVGEIFDVPSPAAVRAAWRPGRFDVMWVHSYHTPMAWLAAENAGAPVVFAPHYHGVGHTPLRHAFHSVFRPAGRRLMTASTRVVAVTDAEARLLLRDFPRELPERKLCVVPTAVPDPVAGRLPFPDTTNVVLTVARQEHYKRTDLLIRAIAEVNRRGVPAHLAVVGDGAALGSYRQLVRESGADDVVTFAGSVDDETLARWWASASMYATASQQEAYGIGLAQALVAGLPVVAADIPAHRELVCRAGAHAATRLCDITGDDDTAARFADAIAELLPSGRTRLERAAQCMLPSTDEMVQQLLGILTEASDMVHRT